MRAAASVALALYAALTTSVPQTTSRDTARAVGVEPTRPSQPAAPADRPTQGVTRASRQAAAAAQWAHVQTLVERHRRGGLGSHMQNRRRQRRGNQRLR
jgi:hypothetical protein